MRNCNSIQILILILFLLRTFTLSAQVGDANKPVRYHDPIFKNVVIQKDIEFGQTINFEGKTEKLLLDIYQPEGDQVLNRPVIIWMHGGGFRPGNDKSQSYIVKIANDFALRGYVCISINYRIRNNPKEDKSGTIADALKDAMTALEWIRNQHQQLGIDLQKIIIGGGSAGGMLAVNFCTKEGTPDQKWNKEGIIGLVNLWGSPDASYLFSAIDQHDPPILTVHGTADKLVPYENTLRLTQLLKDNNVKNELVTLEGGEHTPVKFYDEFSPKISEFLFSLITKK